MAQIRVSRAEFATDYHTLETESASSWDATQSRLDKKWAALTALVDKPERLHQVLSRRFSTCNQ